MQIIKVKDLNIDQILKTLQKGGLVIMPSETLYGACVDATNLEAVKKLTEYKKRPWGKPFSIFVPDEKMAWEYGWENKTAKNLVRQFLPGPLTVVVRGKQKVAAGVESESGTLGIRIPDYQLILMVVTKFGRPITATSANASYQKRPYKVEDILENLSDKQKGLIDLVVDAGELPHNEPSTVVDTTIEDMAVLRQGEIKLKEKDEVVSRGEEDTKNLAKELWQKYSHLGGSRAVVFALKGEMGAGKTIFTKGLARALGVDDEVVSPTYNFEGEYKTKEGRSMVHIDAWRMQNQEEIEQIGWAGRINDKAVISVEWADKVAEVIRKYNEEAVIIWVTIRYGAWETERIIEWGVA